jgi:hypothetical protein
MQCRIQKSYHWQISCKLVDVSLVSSTWLSLVDEQNDLSVQNIGMSRTVPTATSNGQRQPIDYPFIPPPYVHLTHKHLTPSQSSCMVVFARHRG